jgi:hypothetical protein
MCASRVALPAPFNTHTRAVFLCMFSAAADDTQRHCRPHLLPLLPPGGPAGQESEGRCACHRQHAVNAMGLWVRLQQTRGQGQRGSSERAVCAASQAHEQQQQRGLPVRLCALLWHKHGCSWTAQRSAVSLCTQQRCIAVRTAALYRCAHSSAVSLCTQQRCIAAHTAAI